jgi:AcrR family transcriptional regulator
MARGVNNRRSAASAPRRSAPTRGHRTSKLPREALRQSQRDRLVEAIIELAAQRGYQAVSVTELCSRAGISPVTFYEQFAGKEECFLAGYLACGERLLSQMRPLAIEGRDWWETVCLALEVLLRGLERDPDAGRILFVEAFAEGPLIRAERERVLAEFERTVRELVARIPPAAGRGLDVPLMAVIGALRHTISRSLRVNAADQLPSLLTDGAAWLASYAVPASAPRWSTSREALLQRLSDARPPVAWAPETLPRGTHGLPASVIARSQRTRLINATAEVTMAKGYQRATINDIVAAARVARPVFYEHFADKEDAFLEAQDHPTQYVVDCCAQAYFSGDAWPERLWRCLQTLLRLISENPAMSHLRLVECYAAGPAAIRRGEEITRSFTIFLEEGYRQRPQAASLPRLFPQAIAGAIFEVVQRQVEQGRFETLGSYLPQLVYIAIAPFTGAQEAIGLVEELKASEAARTQARRQGSRAGSKSPVHDDH